MLKYDFENSPGYWIYMASLGLRRALNDELASLGITIRQWEVLAWLNLAGPIAQGELAGRMGIEAPTLTRILDRMERDRWIERRDCCHDRRRKLVYPAPAVEPVWSAMVDCGRRVRRRATRGLGRDDLAALRKTLETIQENLKSTRTESAAEKDVRTCSRDF
jgi:MarR family transcriptional regulator for hemolysin